MAGAAAPLAGAAAAAPAAGAAAPAAAAGAPAAAGSGRAGSGGRRRSGGGDRRLFGVDGRRHHRHDGVVDPGVGRLAAFRQLEGGDVHRIVEVHAGEVDDDRFGDRLGRDDQLDAVQHEVDRAALLEAGRSVAVGHAHRHRDAHARARLEAEEVDVHRRVGDRVELVVARQHALLAALDVDLEDRGQELTRIDELVEVFEVDRDRLGRLAAAIDDSRNAAFATNGAGGPLANPAARHGRELLDRCHVVYPFSSAPRLQGCRKRREAGLIKARRREGKAADAAGAGAGASFRRAARNSKACGAICRRSAVCRAQWRSAAQRVSKFYFPVILFRKSDQVPCYETSRYISSR